MLQPIQIKIDLENPEVRKVLTDELLAPEIAAVGKPAAPGAEPDILFIDDEPGDLLGRVRALRRDFTKASIFVISADPSPEKIVQTIKAGANEYFVKPLNGQKVRDAVNRLQMQLLRGEKSADGKVYAFIGSKGGVGTTVLAVNTAAALAGQDAGKVALLDFDFAAGDTSVLVDAMPKTTVADIIKNFQRFDPAFLAGAMERTEAGFDLLAAPPAPEEGLAITAEQIGRILQHARTLYASIVIDCPAMAVEARILESLRGSERIFLNTDLSVPGVRNASRHLKILRRMKLGRIEVVVSRFLKGQSATLEEVEKTLGQRIFWLFPNDFENAIASVNRGVPLAKYNPRSPLYRNILEFAQKLQKPAAHPNYRGIKGLLGKAV